MSKLQQKKTKPSKEQIKKVTDSLEINGEEIRIAELNKKTDAVTGCHNVIVIIQSYEKLIENQKQNVISNAIAYNQGTILKKLKGTKGLTKMAKEIRLNKFAIFFINLLKVYPPWMIINKSDNFDNIKNML